jgi:hypothetical protein
MIRKEGGGYVAGGIKSGAGFEGMSDESDWKPMTSLMESFLYILFSSAKIQFQLKV